MKPEAYALSRGYAASARLDLQHYLWTQETGFLLHPSIPQGKQAKDSEPWKIADIGTGTGIWLLDLSRKIADNTQLHGYDISLAQSPPQAFLPSNMTFQELDAFTKELPPDCKEAYDIVHVRLFVHSCPNGDPLPLLKNAVAMLKPGGWLQWSDIDVLEGSHVMTPEPEASQALAKYNACRQYLADSQASSAKATTPVPSWIPRLAEYFKQSGLQGVQARRDPTSRPFMMVAQEIVWMTWEELSYSLDADKGAKLREMIQEAYQESRRGNAVSVDRLTVVGRKPTA